ncbi:MAG: tail fiber domain-containing protein [Bacteroidia bacterium]
MRRHLLFFSYYLLIVIILQFYALPSYSQVGIDRTGTQTPASSAELDVYSTDKGMLIPRVALTSTASSAPITPAPATSLLVYNTAAVNDVTTGFYYWNGSTWSRLLSGSSNSGYIQNQYAGAQASANHWVSGTGRADNGFRAPYFTTSDYSMGSLPGGDGTFYRYNGQGEITVDDWLYLRDNDNTIRTQFNTDDGSVRPYLMYDLNNTAFYVDPASTSLVNKIRVDGNGTTGGHWAHDPYGYGWGAPYASFRNLEVSSSGNYSTEPALLRIHQWGSGAAELWKPQGTTLYLRETPGGGGGWFNMFEVQANQRVTGNLYAPIMYDNNDNAYYVDPNGTSNINWVTGRTKASVGNTALYNNPRWNLTGDTRYWTGAMGWGNENFNTIYSNWGSGFFDTWSSPANAPGGSSHYVGLQGFHYNHGDGTNAYGFQMAMAGEADNRFFWRSGWPSPRPWVEMVHSGNIGSFGIHNQYSYVQGANFIISGTGRSDGDFRAPIFYDQNNTGYYADPNGVSNLAGITTSVNYNTFHTWTNLPNHTGLYSSNHNGAHFYPNDGSYGSWRILGTRNGWGGLEFPSGAGNISLMIGQGGWGGMTTGMHANSYGWLWRFEHQTLYAAGMWDTDNTGYYSDPNSNSRLANVHTDANLLNWPGYNGITQAYGHHIWPGRNDGSGAAWQQSWYLAGNSSWGLYTNTGLYMAGTSATPFLYDANNTGYYLNMDGTSQLHYVLANNWFRPQGNTGLYWENWGGGWNMEDGTWIRTYGNKSVHINRSGYYAFHPYSPDYTSIYSVCGTNGYWNGQFVGSDYSVYAQGYIYATTYGYLSTREAKKDIEKFQQADYESSLAFVDNLDLNYYKYKKDKEFQTTHVGFIAEETPGNLTTPGKTGVRYGELSIYNTGAIKVLKQRVEKLETKLKNLSDFGSKTLKTGVSFINFSDDFKNQLNDDQPVVMLSANETSTVLNVLEVSKEGFKVENPNNSSVEFNWVAMAKITIEDNKQEVYSAKFTKMLESAEYEAANKEHPKNPKWDEEPDLPAGTEQYEDPSAPWSGKNTKVVDNAKPTHTVISEKDPNEITTGSLPNPDPIIRKRAEEIDNRQAPATTKEVPMPDTP